MTCISLCVIFSTNAKGGEQRDTLPVDQGILTALDLFREGKYFEAAIAYDRVLFEPVNREVEFMAVMGKVECLKKQALFDKAVSILDRYQAFPFPDSDLARIHGQQVLCTYLGGHFEHAISIIDRWPYMHQGTPVTPMMAVLKILSLNELEKWHDAGEYYHAFMKRWAKDTAVDYYLHLPHQKNVMKAKWLSTFIPGAGQLYAGKPWDALFSIAVQTTGVWFAIVSWQQHYYLSAYLVGAALFGAFHMGGVRKAELLVHEYNSRQASLFNKKVRDQLLQVLRSISISPVLERAP